MTHLSRLLVQLAIMTISILAAVTIESQTTWFVDRDAKGGGDGLSWSTAFTDLQAALFFAADGDEVWIAEGEYRPDQGTLDREASFLLTRVVALYGGFSGDEKSLAERDWTKHETVLTGDLLGDDGPNFANRSDNSLHIVRSALTSSQGTCVVDGMTIRGGQAEGSISQRFGGGIRFQEVNGDVLLSVRNCRIVDNFAQKDGAGLWALANRMEVINTTFENNYSITLGAAFAGHTDLASEIVDCRFIGNVSGTAAAAYLTMNHGSWALRSCEFSGNQSTTAGALYSSASGVFGMISLSDCTFVGNTSATKGGAVHFGEIISLIANCLFEGNVADEGGAISTEANHRRLAIANSVFRGNTARHGGAMLLPGLEISLANSIVAGNSAIDEAGAISFPMSSTQGLLSNVTIAGNDASLIGGVAMGGANQAIRFRNAILWANSDDVSPIEVAQIASLIGSDVDISYSCVQGWTGQYGGNGNFSDDPNFVDGSGMDGVYGTADDNLRLAEGSPAIDAGSVAAMEIDRLDLDDDDNEFEVVPFDLDGKVRRLDDLNSDDSGKGPVPIVDLGAYEFGIPPSVIEYVGPSGGFWFIADNWSTGEVPAIDDPVHLSNKLLVIIDQPGATARSVLLDEGAVLQITAGDLVVDEIRIESGQLQLLTPESNLVSRGLKLVESGQLLWQAGSVTLAGGVFSKPDVLAFGSTMNSTLTMHEMSVLMTESVTVGQFGMLNGVGTVLSDVSNSGTVSPGRPTGTLYIDGSFTQTGNSHLLIRPTVEGEQIATGHLATSGFMFLGGTLEIIPEPDFVPYLGLRAPILSASFVNNTFADLDVPQLPNNVTFKETYSETLVELHPTLSFSGPRLYVNAAATGTETGQSWEGALRSFEGAVVVAADRANEVEEVWVAEGTYKPVRQSDANWTQSATFKIAQSVEYYGGFVGDEKSLGERDPVAHVTRFSGDLLGDDRPDWENRGDNAWHIMTVPPYQGGNRVVIDGFVFSSGYGQGSFDQGSGGAIHCRLGMAIIQNNRFEDNQAMSGGAVYIGNDSMVLDCVFINNRSFSSGGALQVLAQTSTATVSHCTFIGNESPRGGAIVFGSEQPGIIFASYFEGNSSSDTGGAVALGGDSSLLVSCVLRGNMARNNGGAVAMSGNGVEVIANCMIIENQVWNGHGGGVSIVGNDPEQRIVNSVLYGNVASGSHGGVTVIGGSGGVAMQNSILWSNVDAQGSGEASQFEFHQNVSVDHCCVMGWSGGFGGTGNFGDNPLFIDAPQNLRLSMGSPCIDTGALDALPVDLFDLDNDGDELEHLPIDLDGWLRVASANSGAYAVDVGPYEYGAENRRVPIDVTVVFGSLLAGSAADLHVPDDRYVVTRSTFGFSVLEPELMEATVGFDAVNVSADTMTITIESRINQPVGSATIKVRNWTTGVYQTVGGFSIGFAENVRQLIGVSTANRIHPNDGRVEILIKHTVAASFSALGFDSFLDRADLMFE